jgi:long-subunit fatty acid transport protein
LLVLLPFGASSAWAQLGFAFNRIGSGARAAGMANAFIAISDDGTAASWNPAGLGQLRKPELSVVSTTAGRRFRAEGFRTRDDSAAFSPQRSSYQNTDLDFASLAAPFTLWGTPVTLQGAWRRLYTLDFREIVSTTREPLIPEGPPRLRIDGNADLIGAVDLISVAGAAKLTSRLALGASLNLWRGDWTEANDIHEIPLDEGPSLPRSSRDREEVRVRGESFSLGLMLTYPRWSVGLLYQDPLHSDFSATGEITQSGLPPAPPETVVGTVLFPRALGLGAAWRPVQRWTVALDLTWDEWSDATFDSPQTGPVNFFDGMPEEKTSTRDTVSLNVGAEHLFLAEGFVVPLRFGIGFEPQGPRSPYTRDPVDFVMGALGTGYNTNSLKFDAAFQFRWAHYRDGADFGISVPRPDLPAAVGERDVKEWRLKLSVILRLTDTEKLRATVRKVFGGA